MKPTSFARRAATGSFTPMASALALTLLSGLTASASASFNPLVDVAARLPAVAGAQVVLPSPAGDVAYYTVVFKEPALASYGGEVAGLPAPARLTQGLVAGKLDLKSPSAIAYVDYLSGKQDAFIAELQSTYGRAVDATARMQHALNAVIVGLTSAEASQVMRRPDVAFVEREHELELHTDHGPTYIGAPAIWDGLTASGVATRGEGIVIGIIDTGINWQSPAFAAVGPLDGYVHQNPRGTGNYLGLCQAGFADEGRCNDKLIGIYNFASTASDRSGVDTQGHGSHTASTAAGNRWEATYASGQFTISGVAPRANVIAYLACPSTCPSTATSQSANQAVIDGVDVINYSISGGTSPWTDATSTAFRNATAAGVFVATSAGNTSTTVPNPQGQVNHLEPWTETVAASTQDRIIAVSLDLDDAGAPANTQDVPMRPGGSPLPTSNLTRVPIIKSPNFSASGNADGCSAYPADTFTRLYVAPEEPQDRIFADDFDPKVTPPERVGGVAVLWLDSTVTSPCASGARRTAAVAAGAVGVIFVNNTYLNLGAAETSWAMLTTDWNALESAIDPATSTVSIDIAAQAFPSTNNDVIADFSFRGPRTIGGQVLLKPGISAPGVDILAVGAANVVGSNGVYLNNGTSMASPHMAGAAALMRALNPTWTPSQVKSAMNLTARIGAGVGTNPDGSPARPWDYGSGFANLAAASKVGLVLDETSANYLAANPATGGEISSLNLASITKNNASGDVTFTRTFRRGRSGSQTYQLAITGLPAGAAEVSPTSFTINSSGSRTVTVTLHSQLLTEAEWNFGQLSLTPAGGDEPALHLPLQFFPAGPAIAVSPTSLSGSSDTTVVNNLSISNTANPTLSWTLQTTGSATLTPINSSSTSNGWSAGYYIANSQGNYWSQNFDVTAAMRVTTLRANGFVLPSTTLTPANTPEVAFRVYADNAGSPAGAPEGFGAAPIWEFAGAISTANGITTTGGALSLNLNAANVAGTPLNLPPGRYWLTVTPRMNGNGGNTTGNPLWAWYVSADAPMGNVPKLYAPWDDAGQFQTATGLNMLSTLVQGTVDCTLPAWASTTTTSGSLGYAGSQTIPITFDATGLAADTYTGNLCIASNATNAPVVPVALSFNVPNGGPQPPALAKTFAPTSIGVGATSTLTITLVNPGPTVATLTASLVDTFPSGLAVAPTPNAATTCTDGVVAANAGEGTVSLAAGASIGAAGSCTVTVDVTSANAGTYENQLAPGALQTSVGNSVAAATATLEATLPACPLENFDAATAPALPAGWTFTNVSGSGTWATVTTAADSAPNAAYSPNLTTAGERLLVSPAFAPTTGSTVVFRNRYNLESTYDGGVLEIAIGGGAFTDIVTAGGTFVSGGYSGTVSAGFGSPIGGRSAWTGTTASAFVTSSVILPAAAAGQPTQLRWRAADDSSTAASGTAGWWVDSISCGVAPPTVTKAFSPAVTTTGQPSTLTISLSSLASTATLTADLVDTFPANLAVAATPNASTTCPSGTVTAAAGSGTVTLGTGAQIPTAGCTVTVNVESATAGIYTNTIAAGALQTDIGASPAAATAIYRTIAAAQATYGTGFESPFTVGALGTQQGWGTTGTASASTISAAAPAAGTQHLRVTSTALAANSALGAISPTQIVGSGTYSVLSAKVRITQTGAGATFELNPQDPAGSVVSTLLRFDRSTGRNILMPNFTTNLYEATGATWPLGTYFDVLFQFNQVARTVEVCINGISIYSGANAVSSPFIGNVVARQFGQSGNVAGNTIDIDELSFGTTGTPTTCLQPPPTVVKAFSPAGVEANEPSTLTITLGNTAPAASTLTAALVDTFPAGLVVAPTPNASTTCSGGSISAPAGSGSVTLASGAQIPPGGCTLSVSVQSATQQDYTSTLPAGAVQTTNGTNASAATAVLYVGNLIASSAPISVIVPANGDGIYFDFVAGTTSTTQTTGSAWNPYGSTNLTFFWPNASTIAPAGVATTTTGNTIVLQPGATIGPSSVFSTATSAANFRLAGNVDGYLGIRFTNTTVTPNVVSYGYVHLATTGTTGHPATVLGYAYNRAGMPITIPTP